MTIERHPLYWFFLLVALAAPSPPRLAAQPTSPPARVSPRDFPMMAWGSSPSDPDQLRGMYESGLNVSGFCRVQDLDRVHFAGLTCFVSDKRANGYDWTNLPEEQQIRAAVAELQRLAGEHPAALGFYLRDEPPVAFMPGLGRVAAILRGGLVLLLWNWLAPPLFGWRQITFWQALAILALCRILFGGSGWHGPVRSVRSNIRRRLEERCESMTLEERERFRQRMRERWGFGPSTSESKEP